MAKKLTYLELFQDKKKRWRFRAKARNGEILAQSQAYSTRWSARRGARRAFPEGVER